jgi:hypothetical protein
MADEMSVQRILGTICDRAGCFAGKDQGELRVCEEFEGEAEQKKSRLQNEGVVRSSTKQTVR